jgi:NAD(P)-dependent dehydrogenase (short-subunit alcohol dehydrogenase family)
MEISLKNKKILVTGAGRGIGRELIRKLVEQGADVFALTNNVETLEDLKKELPAIHPICVDLEDWDATEKSLENIEPLDCLVNNGTHSFPIFQMMEPFLEITKESVDSLYNINVRAVINVCQLVAKKMIAANKSGSIVNVSSAASKTIFKPGLLAYGATKAAVDRLTKGMAAELGAHNIRVNSVNPTVVMTDMGKKFWSRDPGMAGPVLDRTPLGRFAETEDVVNAILFLLSDKSLMTTGTSLLVDGGFLAM